MSAIASRVRPSQIRATAGLRMSAIPGDIGGFACVLNFGDVPPRVGLTAVEVGEAVDLRQLPARQRLSVPARYVGILCEGRYRAAHEGGTLRDGEVGRARGRIMPVRLGDAVGVEHRL